MLKKRKKIKSILLILCLFQLCMLTGCKTGKDANESTGNQITMTPTETPSTENSGEAETEEAETEEADPKIEDFSILDEYMKDYTFDVSYDETLLAYQRTYSIHGAYDLNGDGIEDTINAELIGDYVEGSYLEVNGIKITLDPNNLSGDMYLIDLNSKDNYTEIAIFDNGPSADPNYIFFQYDGKELYSIGSIDSYALMNGQGKLISWFHYTNKFNPQFYSAWKELKDNKFVQYNHDIEQYIGKTYEVDGTGFFVPLDHYPENYFEYTTWDFETQIEFNATKIKLLDFYIDTDDRMLNWFYVEMPEGERGLLYFWIGD